MFFRYHGNFSIKLSHVLSYMTTCIYPRTLREWKKACFLQILKSPSVARCWSNADFFLSCHKHKSRVPIELSRMSKSPLDEFLGSKTWFFVFSKLHVRCVAKVLRSDIWFFDDFVRDKHIIFFSISTKWVLVKCSLPKYR